uniref:Reverse transcriptase domain-containing protein n=1 Tax=Bougainvillea spectabilis TaxID=146096 RepID=A0A7T1T1Z1_9CARY|nr:hypothetical protein KQ602_mgp20 [Bougainvillea spectabilis]QPP04904.1 hypothetical protein [Bougainvillea spectabilis]
MVRYRKGSCLTFLFVRYLSIDRMIVQLTSDIESVYQDMKEHNLLHLSDDKYIQIQNLILLGLYVPLVPDVKWVKGYELIQFLDNIKHKHDVLDIIIYNKLDESYYIILPNLADALVYRGMCVLLLRLSYGSLPKGVTEIESLLDYQFFSGILNIRKAKRIFIIDLSPTTIHIITKSQIQNILKIYVGEGTIHRIISNFISFYIYDFILDKNLDLNELRYIHLPSINQLYKVLMNLVYIEIFDRPLQQKKPSIIYHRYYDNVFLFSKENNDEKEIDELLEDLGIKGDISTMLPGDEPYFFFRTKFIYLDDDSKVVAGNFNPL